MNETPEKRLDLLIDQALRDFPLDPAPAGLKDAIMGRVGDRPLWSRFRISWYDFALSGILAVIIGFALNFVQGMVRSPYWTARFRIAFLLFFQDIRLFLMQNKSALQASLLSTGTILLLLVILASVYWRFAAYSAKLPA